MTTIIAGKCPEGVVVACDSHANNNRVERLNGTLRERVKVQRGWKNPASKIAEGQRLHYNFVKPHMALEGQTPAQAAQVSKGKATWGAC